MAVDADEVRGHPDLAARRHGRPREDRAGAQRPAHLEGGGQVEGVPAAPPPAVERGAGIDHPDPLDAVQVAGQEVDEPFAQELHALAGRRERQDGDHVGAGAHRALHQAGPKPPDGGAEQHEDEGRDGSEAGPTAASRRLSGPGTCAHQREDRQPGEQEEQQDGESAHEAQREAEDVGDLQDEPRGSGKDQPGLKRRLLAQRPPVGFESFQR